MLVLTLLLQEHWSMSHNIMSKCSLKHWYFSAYALLSHDHNLPPYVLPFVWPCLFLQQSEPWRRSLTFCQCLFALALPVSCSLSPAYPLSKLHTSAVPSVRSSCRPARPVLLPSTLELRLRAPGTDWRRGRPVVGWGGWRT